MVVMQKANKQGTLENQQVPSLDLPTWTKKLKDAFGDGSYCNCSHPSICKCGPDKFRIGWLLRNVTRKYLDRTGHRHLDRKTFDKLRASEEVGAKFNASEFALDPVVLATARSIIKDILGPLNIGKVLSNLRFSGGATTDGSRQVGHVSFKIDPLSSPRKFQDGRKRYTCRKMRRLMRTIKNTVEFGRPVDVTPSAYKYALAYCLSDRQMANADVARRICLIRGNHVDSVSKTAEIARTIAKEPSWNMAMQLAAGTFMKECLLLVGVNLYSQITNQQLAYEGSVHGMLTTADIEDASNTVWYRTVLELLPEDWFTFLDEIRSRYGRFPDTGKWHLYQMFSSMGNGFTFELESLIFYAVSKAVIRVNNFRGDVSVYGDDIIVPTESWEKVSQALKACGFTPNLSKTFSSGPFRESCGKHYYAGHDVSHFMIKEPIDSPNRVVWLLNRLRWWSSLGSIKGICDPRVYHLWRELYKQYPFCRSVDSTDDYSSESLIVKPGRGQYRIARDYSDLSQIPDSFGLYYSKLWRKAQVLDITTVNRGVSDLCFYRVGELVIALDPSEVVSDTLRSTQVRDMYFTDSAMRNREKTRLSPVKTLFVESSRIEARKRSFETSLSFDLYPQELGIK